jgi:hypothetical protein
MSLVLKRKPLIIKEKDMLFNTMIIMRICPPPLLACCEFVQDRHAGRDMIRKGLRNHKLRGGMPWMESRESFYLILKTVCSQRFPENSWFKFLSFFQTEELP